MRCELWGISWGPVVTRADDLASARKLVGEALGLLDDVSDAVAVYHLRAVLALLDPQVQSAGGKARNDQPGDAFARAIGAMALIVEQAIRGEGTRCVKAIAAAMKAHSHEVARHDMGAALLLDRWAEIIQERGDDKRPGPRRDN